MKILVTGGAGFIGSHVVRAFLQGGHEVVVLDDLSSGRRENLPAGVRLLVADVRDPAIEKLLMAERFDVVDHHAAQISVPASVADPRFDADVNLVGLVNLLESCARSGVKRFIYISSGGAIYGEPKNLPVAEDCPPRPLSPYATSKLAGELFLGYYQRARGLDYVTLRYANVYGPRQIPHGEAGVVAIFMRCLRTGQPPVIYRSDDMPQGMERDYVFAGDCAQANLLALTQGQGAYNIGTGLTTTTLKLWQAVQEACGQSLPHGFGPHREGDSRSISLNCSRAAAELGWRPQHDLVQGLAQTWAWLTQES